jgi:F420-dependent oxidoreductase-like protein
VETGVILPQGWLGEYDGWDPSVAWARTLTVAAQAERIGFESAWVFDHFHTQPEPSDEITFESFTTLGGGGAATRRLRLGHVVACAGYRNPALVAKMISTLDVISGGRMELGLGAGWKQDEWVAYGYPFPPLRERLAILEDTLEVVTRMLSGDRHEHATFDGRHSRVDGAINVPKPIQPRGLPVIVGGNGPNVTWRLAARFASELNLDGLEPHEVVAAVPVIRSRCEEIGRDPDSLRLSINVFWSRVAEPGDERVRLLEGYRKAGLDRLICLIRDAADNDEALPSFANDALAAGASLGNPGSGA